MKFIANLIPVLGAVIGIMLSHCTPAQREKLAVPTLSLIDALGSTIDQAAEWARDHGADEQLVLETLQAVSDKDPRRAVTIVRKLLEALAAKGEPIPPQVVALVQTTEYALAAEAIQDAMRALSAPANSAAPLPSSGL